MKKNRLALFMMIVVIAIMAVSLTACGGDEVKSDTGYSSTILIYLCGSDLEGNYGSATSNIAELLNSDIPKDTALIIETGGARAWRDYDIPADKICRYRVQNHTLTLLDTLDDASMGREDTLTSFLDYGITNYPSKKTSLIMWNHGGGGLGGVCFDERHGFDSISLSEMESALVKAKKKMGRKFHMIGFDACTMGTIEVADIVYDYANYMIASAETEPLGGWSYTNIVENISSRDGLTRIVDDYATKCEADNTHDYTLSLVDFSRYNAVQQAYYDLIDAITSGSVSLRQLVLSFKASLSYDESFDREPNYIDIEDFASHIGMDTMATALEGATYYRNGTDRLGAGPLSITMPIYNDKALNMLPSMPFDDDYKRFLVDNFAKDNRRMISFVDAGSDHNGELGVRLTRESMDYVQEVRYKLYRFVEDATNPHMTNVYCLGNDYDLDFDGVDSYVTSFGGRWANWVGEYIECELIYEENDIALYATPAKVNGAVGNIRFRYSRATKEFSIIGFIANRTNDDAINRTIRLKAGDNITLLYDDRTFELTPTLVEGKSFTYDSQPISVTTLPAGYFQMVVIVSDIYDNELRSNTAVSYWDGMKMTINTIADDSNNDLE